MIKISVMISVTVKTVNISKVLEHWVKKIVIGAQLRVQFTPHWKTVAKKNVKLHADTITIMTQLALLNARTWPKIRRHRNRMESLIRPNASFSVVWKPYLYYENDVSYETKERLINKEYLLCLVFFLGRNWPVIHDR